MMSSRNNNRGRALVITVAVIVAVVAVFAIRFTQLGRDTALASIRSEQERLGIPVEIVKAERRELARWTNLAGTVEGVTQYAVVSGNALRIVGIPVVEGMRVEKGDAIIRLADETPNPMFHSLSRSRANHDNALREAQRMRNLYAEGAVSKQALDRAETSLRVAEADLQSAEGSTVLTASEDGVVAAILVLEGDTVSPNKPLVWITDTHEVHVKFAAGSNQALSLGLGLEAVWKAPGGGEVTGSLTQLDLMADPATHLLSGKVTFPNEDGRLLPGLLVSFVVRTDYRPQAIAVPAASLTAEAMVWRVTGSKGDLSAEKTAVTVGLQTTDYVEITEGLEPGAVVVLHGQTLLTDGVKVNDVTGPGGE